MRKITIAAAIVASVVVVGGCGSSDEDAGSGRAEAAFQALKPGESSVYCEGECKQALRIDEQARNVECRVGVSWSDTSFPYGAASITRSEETAKGFPNMTLTTADGRGDAATQSGQIDDMVAAGIDVLVVSPADAKAIAPAVRRATERDVKVIASDRSVDAPVVTYVGADNVEDGRVAGEYVAQLAGDGGKVVELQGTPGASPTIARNKGFEEAIEAAGNVEVIASQAADYDRSRGLTVMQDLLQRFGRGEIDAVFTHNDEMSIGAIQAIREAGREDEIDVVGIDGQQSALDLIEAGRYAGTVVYPLPVPEHILAAAKACAGQELPERITQSAPLVTKENLAKYDGTTF